jgi:putative tricarboxylic transport membrane protein
MKLPYQIAGTVFLIISAWIAKDALALKYYTELGPGPGFFPFWLAIIFAILSIVMVLQATFGRTDPMPPDFLATKSGYLRNAGVILAVAAAAAFIDPLGFRLTTLLILLFLLFVLGRQNLIVTILLSLFGSFGVYHVFMEWLMIPLPVGIFGI